VPLTWFIHSSTLTVWGTQYHEWHSDTSDGSFSATPVPFFFHDRATYYLHKSYKSVMWQLFLHKSYKSTIGHIFSVSFPISSISFYNFLRGGNRWGDAHIWQKPATIRTEHESTLNLVNFSMVMRWWGVYNVLSHPCTVKTLAIVLIFKQPYNLGLWRLHGLVK